MRMRMMMMILIMIMMTMMIMMIMMMMMITTFPPPRPSMDGAGRGGVFPPLLTPPLPPIPRPATPTPRSPPQPPLPRPTPVPGPAGFTAFPSSFCFFLTTCFGSALRPPRDTPAPGCATNPGEPRCKMSSRSSVVSTHMAEWAAKAERSTVRSQLSHITTSRCHGSRRSAGAAAAVGAPEAPHLARAPTAAGEAAKIAASGSQCGK
mmetsp:Transcript_23380/g.54154  ORF Transcript_23380/g.54154 Transcript_23380/m.54154 type:complete len:206 (+) Transcript_23380:99-716(+)